MATTLSVITWIKARTQEPIDPCVAAALMRQEMSRRDETVRIDPEPAFPMMQLRSSSRRWPTHLCLIMCIATLVMSPAHANDADFNRLRQQGEQAQARGDLPQSIRAALKMLELKPNDLATMLTLSGLYGKAGQAEQQLVWTRKILQLQPNHFDALINQGNAQAVLGNVKAAQDSFGKARRLDPSSPVAPYSLGVLAQSLGQDQEAIAFFQAALKLSPAFEDAWFNLAVSQANTGLVREAIRNLDQLLRANPAAQDARELRNALSRP